MATFFAKKTNFFIPIISVKSDVLHIRLVLEDPVGIVNAVLPLVGLGRLLGRAQELRHLLQFLVEGETVLDHHACSSSRENLPVFRIRIQAGQKLPSKVKNKIREEISSFEVLDVLFSELKASPVVFTYFRGS